MMHRLVRGTTTFLLMVLMVTVGFAADHLDAPPLTMQLDADNTDVYAFVGANPNATVLAVGFTPVLGEGGHFRFGTDIIYQFNIYDAPPPSHFDVTAGTAYRFTFGNPDANGIQPFNLYRSNGTLANGHVIHPADLLLSGSTGRIENIPGGGQVFAGQRSDPFFFDLEGFQGEFGEEANGRAFNDGNEDDFFEGFNVMAIVLEVPDSDLPDQGPGGEGFGVWASTGDLASGDQIDRMGRPAMNWFMNSPGTLIGAPPSNRDDFNGAHPRDDDDYIMWINLIAEIYSDMDSEGPFTQSQLDQIAAIYLPDTLFVSKNDPSLPPPLNGRRLDDDVLDFQLNFLSGGDPLGLFPGRDATGNTPTDGIGPHDNYLPHFPYLGPSQTPLFGGWSDTVVFSQQPLEAKLGTFTEDSDPNALGMVIWNDGVDNVLTAITIPPPYNGSGVSTETIGSDPVLFALGDVCTQGTTAIVPAIVDFSVGVVTVDSSGKGDPVFSLSMIPGTIDDPHDSADCGVTQDGIFITTHNDLDNAIDVYKVPDPGMYTFYGRYPDPVAGPFDGGLRDQFVTNRNGSEAAGLFQRPDGAVRVTTFNTSQNPPVFNTETVMNFPPPAGFTHVEESGGTSLSRLGTAPGFCMTYNVDGNARVVEFPASDPSMLITRNLGSVNNGGGTHFSFSGGTIVGQPTQTNVIWGDFFVIDPLGDVIPGTDEHYPNIGAGGPVDGCFVFPEPGVPDELSNAPDTFFLTGRSVTRLMRRRDPPVSINDGFETQNVQRIWFCD